MTAVVIFFPAFVSVGGLLGTSGLFCTGRSKGANINHGLVLAVTAASVVGVLFLILVFVLEVGHRNLWSSQLRHLIAGACVLEAAALAVAIAFVALDSATYVSTNCSFMGPATNEVGHTQSLYYLWGFAIAVLLVQALRVARYSPPPPPPEPEPEISGPPLD